MADSTRQAIMEALDTRLKAIKTTSGYKTNAGLHVFDWLDRDLADSELDAIVYRDKSCEMDGTQLVTDYYNRLRVEIEVKTKQASGTAERLRNILEDVCYAIGTDETFGGLADNTEPVENSIEIQQADKIMGSASLLIEIEYKTNKWSF